ncbi:hypothetical protein GBA52_010487 [Prunus armeniaca]|nr:hypothetical protein GBA52_010487 [Prunus armeniaca]
MPHHTKWHVCNHLVSLTIAYPSLDPKTTTFTHNDSRSVNLFQGDVTIPMVNKRQLSWSLASLRWLAGDKWQRVATMAGVSGQRRKWNGGGWPEIA